MIDGDQNSNQAEPQVDLQEIRQDFLHASGGMNAPAGGNCGQQSGAPDRNAPEEQCDAISISDRNRKLTYWNAAAERMFGWRADEVLGKPFTGLLQEEYPGCSRDKAFALFAGKEHFEVKAVLRHKNGSTVYASIYTIALPGEGGVPEGVLAIFKDMSKRGRQEGSPLEQEMEPQEDAVAMADNNQLVSHWNTAAEKMFGWRADEVLGKPVAGLLQAEYPGCGREQAFAQTKEAGCFHSEAALRHKNGSPVYVSIYSGVRRGEDESVVGTFTIFRDISANRKIERRLSDSEKEYLEVIDSPTAGAFVHDLQKGTAFYSTVWKKRLDAENFSPAQLANLPALVVHPDDYPRLQATLKKAVAIRAARVSLEVRVKTADAGYRWVLGQARIKYGQKGEPLQYIGTNTDVTEQKIMTESLHLQADVLAGVHDGVIAIGQDNRICYWNRMVEELSGVPAQDLLGTDATNVLQLGLVDYESAVCIKRSLEKYGQFTGEVKARRRNGAIIWGNAHVKKTGGDGSFQGIVITFRDITASKQAEEQLSFQANLLDSANEGILFVNKDYVITYWNSGAEKQYGWAKEEALGKKVQELLMLQTPEGNLEDIFRLVLKEGSWSGEVIARRKDGVQIWIESFSRTLQDEQGSFMGLVNSTRNITNRKQYQAKIARQNAALQAINRVYLEYVACDTLEQLGTVCLRVAEEATGSRISFLGDIGEDGLFHDVTMSEAGGEKCGLTDHPGREKTLGVFPVRGLYGAALRGGETLLINDPAKDPENMGLPEGHRTLECILAVPYMQGGQARGMIAVGNRPGGYGGDERKILEALTPTIMGVILRKRAEIALQESESLYRTLIENTEDAFMLLEPIFDQNDPDRVADVRFVRVSRNFKMQTGVAPEEVTGKTLLTLFPDIEPYWIREFAQAAHSRVPLHYQNYHGYTNRWYDMLCFPYGKGLTGVLFRNVTEKKQTEAELLRVREELAQRAVDKYQALFQSIDEGFCIMQVEINPDSAVDYRILEANAQYHLQTGVPLEMLGRSMRTVLPGNDECWYDLFAQVAATGNPERQTSLYSTPNNRWYDVYAFPAGECGSGLVAALFKDITEQKRSEDILRENERLYRTIFENSQEGFTLSEIVYDENGRPVDNIVLEINKAYEKLAGVRAADIVGKRGRVLARHMDQAWLNKQDVCVKTHKTMHFEEYQGDTGRWLDVFMFPYGEKSFGELFHNITRRKQYEESLHQSELLYRKLFDNTEEGFMLCQPVIGEDGDCTDGYILSVNKGWELQTGMRAEDGILEKPISQILENIEKSWLSRFGQVAKTGRSINFEEYNHNTDRWYDVHAFLYKEDVVGVLMRNISDRHRTEEALRESQRKAFKLVREMGEINRNKNEFLNTLSHELRNPLAAISAGIQLMDMTQDDKHVKKAKDVIRRQMNQLCRLTDDLLDLTRISNNKIRLQKEQVDLNLLASLAAEDHRALFEEKGVIIQMEMASAPVLLEADPVRLRQAIGNLLHNALKFTDRGGKALLQVTLEDGWAVITVSDTGLGIEECLLPRLFEPFHQADVSLDRRNSGLGLGLSITRGIAELHGGSVSAYSAGLKQGSRFTIRLPAGKSAPQALEEDGAEACAPAPLSILLIEDNPDQAEMLCMALREMGHNARYALDGESGLREALDFKPEVVLCDIGLPCMDGYAVARAIRSEPTLSHTVLVALSGFAADRYKKRAREAGFMLHTSKPVDMDTLKKLLAGVRTGNTETDA